MRRRDLWASLGLLLPSLVLMVGIYGVGMAIFLLYSFYHVVAREFITTLTLATYRQFVTDAFTWRVIGETLRLSAVVTAWTVVLGYPAAYAIHKVQHPAVRRWIGVLIFAPLLVSVVVRTYGWMILLSSQGVVNYVLLRLGLAQTPVRLIYNFTGVTIGMVHILLPFMIFSVLSVLGQLPPALKEAAMDLGANRWQTFLRVTLPLTLQGLVAGCQIVFPLALGAFVTPALLGGGRVLVLSRYVFESTIDVNWPLAAVGGIALLVMAMVAVWGFDRLLRGVRYAGA